jgi:hypothetical protein
MWAYGTVGIGMIRYFAPDYAHFTVEENKLKARFQAAHDRSVQAIVPLVAHWANSAFCLLYPAWYPQKNQLPFGVEPTLKLP